MPKSIWKTKFLILLLLLGSVLVGFSPQAVQAQSADQPPLTIVAVETAQFPTIQLTLAGTAWPTERATAPLQILVDGAPQTLVDDRVVQQAIGFMVAIDANDLFVNGEAGQTRYAEMTGALLDLIENKILLRNQDWLAATLLLPETVQSIQEWTQEPNLVFNSIVQKPPPERNGAPLTAPTLITALQQFQASPAAAVQPKVLLLISTGAPGLDIALVVTAAQGLGVQIHVVELVSQNRQTDAASPLAQVAQQTGGHYLALDNPAALPPLWERIAAAHNSRVVSFQSTVATPQTLEVRLALPAGATLSATAGPEAFAALPVVAPVAAPAVQEVVTRAETQSTVAYSPPVTSSAQAAAVPPAVDVAPPVAAALPPSDASNSTAQNSPGSVTTPGLSVALPRGLLQFGLVVLLGLIAYFVYAEVRDRRKLRNPASQPQPTAEPRFVLGENSEPLPASQFRLREDGRSAVKVAVDPPPARLASPPPARPPVRPTPLFQTEGDNEAEPTIRPARMEDDEATYRPQSVEQPIIGYLVRTTSDPNLPKELAIYGLNPTPGEVRQIHVGRHSKHNTVVINDKSISREHAVIIQRQGRLYLRDNASTSGTFLNWKRLNAGEELLLRHNDLISFGQIVYEFRLHGEDEVTIGES